MSTCPEPGGCESCPDPNHCRRARIEAGLTLDAEERDAGLEPRNHWAIRLRWHLLRSGSSRWNAWVRDTTAWLELHV